MELVDKKFGEDEIEQFTEQFRNLFKKECDMELFDKKFVHFMWEDELEGKKGFVHENIANLRKVINSSQAGILTTVRKSSEDDIFVSNTNNRRYYFFYYDPNLEIKKAYLEGKQIQFYGELSGEWIDCEADCIDNHLTYFDDDYAYRIKPESEEKKYRSFKDCRELAEFWRVNYSEHNAPKGTMPLIWVKSKEHGTGSLITAFDNDTEKFASCIFIQDVWVDMSELFEEYTFLDGSPCGVLED